MVSAPRALATETRWWPSRTAYASPTCTTEIGGKTVPRRPARAVIRVAGICEAKLHTPAVRLAAPVASLVREALGVASELRCTGERAEEVGGVLVGQPPGGAFGIDGHAADGVPGEIAPGRFAGTHGGE